MASTSSGQLTPMPRIIGGAEATPHSFPHVLALNHRDQHSCGAGLITETVALTAAHCISDGNPASSYSVSVFRHYLAVTPIDDHPDGCTESIHAATVITHPEYNQGVPLHADVALIKLARAPRCVDQIPLLVLDAGDASAPGTLATVAGWGNTISALDTYTYGEYPSELHTISLPLLENDVCEAKLSGSQQAGSGSQRSLLDAGMICAGFLPGGHNDTCQGDSGGTLFVAPSPSDPGGQPVAVGIVSWGFGCAAPNSPGVYTRVSRYKPWCDHVIAMLAAPPSPPFPPQPPAPPPRPPQRPGPPLPPPWPPIDLACACNAAGCTAPDLGAPYCYVLSPEGCPYAWASAEAPGERWVICDVLPPPPGMPNPPYSPPFPPRLPGPPGAPSGLVRCRDRCFSFTADGECDDGGEGSEYTSCSVGLEYTWRMHRTHRPPPRLMLKVRTGVPLLTCARVLCSLAPPSVAPTAACG